MIVVVIMVAIAATGVGIAHRASGAFLDGGGPPESADDHDHGQNDERHGNET
jgi:hypothetical protein